MDLQKIVPRNIQVQRRYNCALTQCKLIGLKLSTKSRETIDIKGIRMI